MNLSHAIGRLMLAEHDAEAGELRRAAEHAIEASRILLAIADARGAGLRLSDDHAKERIERAMKGEGK